MKKLIWAVAVAGLLMPALASAEDLHIPTWRGTPGSTYQQWTFDSNFGETPIFSEVDNNSYGVAGIDGDDDSIKWLNSYEGRNGVFRARDYESPCFDIPNHSMEGKPKEVWVQVVWHWDGPPGYSWNPMTDGWLGWETKHLGDWWFYEWMWLEYDESPNHESLTFTNGCEFIYLDEVIIETYVPEPASLALLAIGGLAALRRRR